MCPLVPDQVWSPTEMLSTIITGIWFLHTGISLRLGQRGTYILPVWRLFMRSVRLMDFLVPGKMWAPCVTFPTLQTFIGFFPCVSSQVPNKVRITCEAFCTQRAGMLPTCQGVARNSFPSICGTINLRNICTKSSFIKSTCIILKDYFPIWSLVNFWVCQNRPVCIFLLNTFFLVFAHVSYRRGKNRKGKAIVTSLPSITRGFLMAFLTNDRESTEEAKGRRVWLSEKDISDGWHIGRTRTWVRGMATGLQNETVTESKRQNNGRDPMRKALGGKRCTA